MAFSRFSIAGEGGGALWKDQKLSAVVPEAQRCRCRPRALVPAVGPAQQQQNSPMIDQLHDFCHIWSPWDAQGLFKAEAVEIPWKLNA